MKNLIRGILAFLGAKKLGVANAAVLVLLLSLLLSICFYDTCLRYSSSIFIAINVTFYYRCSLFSYNQKSFEDVYQYHQAKN